MRRFVLAVAAIAALVLAIGGGVLWGITHTTIAQATVAPLSAATPADPSITAGGGSFVPTPTPTTASASGPTESQGTPCSNKAIRQDHNPALHPEGWSPDPSKAWVLHLWSNLRGDNLNPQNFPSPDGKKTNQHEFIMLVKIGDHLALPPGTGGSGWWFECDQMATLDYNTQIYTEGFVPITPAQVEAYATTGNPWGGTASAAPTPSTGTCQDKSVGQPINHPPVKNQTWTLTGNRAYVVHIWSNQFQTNLNPQNFDIPSKQSEFIYVTSIGPDDVVFPVGTGGKAWAYECDSAAQTDYAVQMSQEGFVPITWDQLQSYALTGKLS